MLTDWGLEDSTPATPETEVIFPSNLTNMQIDLKLMGVLKPKTPQDGRLELPDSATIKDALLALEIPLDSVQVFTVNGKLVRDKNHTLNDGDDLTILPPVGGG